MEHSTVPTAIGREFDSMRTLGSEVALVLSGNHLSMQQRPSMKGSEPDGFVVIDMSLSAFCGADYRFVHGTKLMADRPDAIIPGHACVGYVDGKLVVAQPHMVSSALASTQAYQAGKIYQLPQTYHFGMQVNGTFASELLCPKERLHFISNEIEQRAAANLLRAVPKNAVFCEFEHVACCATAIAHFETEDQRLGGNTHLELKQGGRAIAVIGAGWMGCLMLALLQRKYPGNHYALIDPNQARCNKVADICAQAGLASPHNITNAVDDHADSIHLVVLATAAKPATETAFKLVKANGHVILFSGLDDRATTDPSGLVVLERVHRLGTGIAVNAIDRKPYVMSGSSGYSLACFNAAGDIVADIAGAISLGITGVIARDSAELHSLDPDVPSIVSDHGTALERIFDAEGEWQQRVSQHLKIVWLADGGR